MKFKKKKNLMLPKGIIKYSTIYVFSLIFAVIIGICSSIPDNQTYFINSKASAVSSITQQDDNASGSYTVEARLFGKIPVKQVNVEIIPETHLIPVGDIFGVKFFTKGVIVIGTTEIESADGFINPAEKAGLKKKDIITKINGTEINTVEALAKAVENSKGKPLYAECIRDGETFNCEITPVLSLSDKKYKTGIWVRDSTAGIGTITYIDPENNSFAGLGHGICDIDTGELMPLLRGTVVDVEISNVIMGKSGEPGELKGTFDTEKKGVLIKNTDAGVFGILDSLPDNLMKPMQVGSKTEVCEGAATILVNADGKGVKEYTVNLSRIDKNSDGTKCFVVQITDQELISLTGGIVQGMSGSPIIQNDKFIGAVTHVLVDDPTKGYGIFLENMLSKDAESFKS